MGAQNCCLKPDVKKTEVQSTQLSEGIVDIDKDGYPHDSQQPYGAEGENKAEFEAQNQVSNQEIYNKEAQSPQMGNTYEVAINANNPNDLENEEKENNQNIQSPNKVNSEEKNNVEQENSPGPEDGNVMEQQQVEEKEEKEETKEKEENKEEQVEEEVEEQVEVEEQEEGIEEEQGEGGNGEEEERSGGEEEEGQNEEENDPLLAATVNDTNYITGNNNLNIPQTGEVEHYEYINGQYYKVIQSNDANEGNSYVNNYNESGAFISAVNSNNAFDINNLNNIPVVEPTAGTENVDLNQYFQQGAGVSSGNFDLNNYSVNLNNNLGISTAVPEGNYYQSTNLELNKQNTGTFDINNLNLGQTNSNNVEVPQYNIGVSMQSGNDISSSYAMQGNTFSYVGGTSYNIPAGTTNSTMTFAGDQVASSFNNFGQYNNIESSYAPVQA